MAIYDQTTKEAIRSLRKEGFTYSEIELKLNRTIPKTTLNYICRGIVLTKKQTNRIDDLMLSTLGANREKALLANRKILENKIAGYNEANKRLARFMQDPRAKLMCLSMLYLGEGAKWISRRGLMLGSSSPMIVNLYIKLLEECYQIDKSILKARIQYRADQDYENLLNFWSGITGIAKTDFYKGYVDKRTIGKPTLKPDYRGVCVITCAGTHVQLELEQIAVIISEAIGGVSSVG